MYIVDELSHMQFNCTRRLIYFITLHHKCTIYLKKKSKCAFVTMYIVRSLGGVCHGELIHLLSNSDTQLTGDIVFQWSFLGLLWLSMVSNTSIELRYERVHLSRKILNDITHSYPISNGDIPNSLLPIFNWYYPNMNYACNYLYLPDHEKSICQ